MQNDFHQYFQPFYGVEIACQNTIFDKNSIFRGHYLATLELSEEDQYQRMINLVVTASK